MCCPLFILRMNSTAGCFSHFLKNLWSQWRHSSLRWVLFEHLSVFSPQSFLKRNKTFHKLFPEISEAETLTQSECSFRSTVCYSFADIDYGDDITHCGPFFSFLLFDLVLHFIAVPCWKKTAFLVLVLLVYAGFFPAGWSAGAETRQGQAVLFVFREPPHDFKWSLLCLCVFVCVGLCRSVHLCLAEGGPLSRQTLCVRASCVLPLVCAAQRNKGNTLGLLKRSFTPVTLRLEENKLVLYFGCPCVGLVVMTWL